MNAKTGAPIPEQALTRASRSTVERHGDPHRMDRGTVGEGRRMPKPKPKPTRHLRPSATGRPGSAGHA